MFPKTRYTNTSGSLTSEQVKSLRPDLSGMRKAVAIPTKAAAFCMPRLTPAAPTGHVRRAERSRPPRREVMPAT